MSSLMFLLLLLAAMAWLLLPLIPALRELLHPADAEALTQVGHDAGDLAIFATGFRRYLERELASGDDPATPGQLRDGTPLLQLTGQTDVLRRAATPEGAVASLVLVNEPVVLPGNETFLYEVYARDRFVGGSDAVYRALLVERDAELGPRSRVLRWLHVEGDAVVGDAAVLEGRASVAGTMWLGANVQFGRVVAARIVSGPDDPRIPTAMEPVLASTMKLPRTAKPQRGFVRIDGDLEIPAGTSLVGHVVVYGNVSVGEGARVAGSIKSHGDCRIGRSAVVQGAIVARRSVHLGEGARSAGPVIAERDITLASGASVGRPDAPSSLTGERVTVHPGSQVFGAISARREGTTGHLAGATR